MTQLPRYSEAHHIGTSEIRPLSPGSTPHYTLSALLMPFPPSTLLFTLSLQPLPCLGWTLSSFSIKLIGGGGFPLSTASLGPWIIPIKVPTPSSGLLLYLGILLVQHLCSFILFIWCRWNNNSFSSRYYCFLLFSSFKHKETRVREKSWRNFGYFFQGIYDRGFGLDGFQKKHRKSSFFLILSLKYLSYL